MPYKKYVSLYFYKGTSLSDPDGLLEGSGKALRHIKIHKPEDIHVEKMTKMIQEAVKLDSKRRALMDFSRFDVRNYQTLSV